MMRDERRIFVVTEASAKFLMPAKLNDELIVTASLGQQTRATFEIQQCIYRNSLDGQLLVRGNVNAAYLDADTMKPKRVPPTLFEENPS